MGKETQRLIVKRTGLGHVLLLNAKVRGEKVQDWEAERSRLGGEVEKVRFRVCARVEHQGYWYKDRDWEGETEVTFGWRGREGEVQGMC